MFPSPEVASAPARNRRLSTVQQFCRNHPDLTESAVRWIIYQSKPRHHTKSLTKPNGFDMVIFRRGRRVLLDEDQYCLWLEMQNEEASRG